MGKKSPFFHLLFLNINKQSENILTKQEVYSYIVSVLRGKW